MSNVAEQKACLRGRGAPGWRETVETHVNVDLEEFFPQGISFSIVSAGDPIAGPNPAELELLSERASPKRRQEFVLGRAAAREALRKQGFVDPPAVLRADAGFPLWPPGITGSISHSKGIAASAVAPAALYRGLGLDLQCRRSDIAAGLERHICTADEQRWVNSLPSERHARIMLIFSAKESVFKALHPVTKIFFGFKDVCLQWISASHSFHIELLKPELLPWRSDELWIIKAHAGSEYVLTLAVLRSG